MDNSEVACIQDIHILPVDYTGWILHTGTVEAYKHLAIPLIARVKKIKLAN